MDEKKITEGLSLPEEISEETAPEENAPGRRKFLMNLGKWSLAAAALTIGGALTEGSAMARDRRHAWNNWGYAKPGHKPPPPPKKPGHKPPPPKHHRWNNWGWPEPKKPSRWSNWGWPQPRK